MKARSVVLTLVLLLMSPAWATAQPAEGPRAEGPRAEGPRHDRARTFLVLRISETLDLPDEKALQVSRIIREADEKRRDLRASRKEVEKNLRAVLGRPQPDGDEVKRLVVKANEIDQQLALIPHNGFREIQEILTVEQQGQLTLLVPDIQRQIRRTMKRRMREHHDRSPRFPARRD